MRYRGILANSHFAGGCGGNFCDFSTDREGISRKISGKNALEPTLLQLTLRARADKRYNEWILVIRAIESPHEFTHRHAGVGDARS